MDDLKRPTKAFEPVPSEWLTQSRLHILDVDLLAARETLATSGLLHTAISHWIRQQISIEEINGIDKLALKHSKSTTISTSHESAESSNRPTKESINHYCMLWAKRHWGNKLETLFLKHKDDLDVVNFRMISVEDKGLSREIYHRIKAEEEAFELLAMRFDEGEEKRKLGLYSKNVVSSLPEGFSKIISNLKNGEVLAPFKFGNKYRIFQLGSYMSASFDNETCEKLLNSELSQWVQETGNLALNHLECSNILDEVIP